MRTRRSFEEWARLYSAKVEPFVLRQPEAVLFHEAHGIMTFAVDPAARKLLGIKVIGDGPYWLSVARCIATGLGLRSVRFHTIRDPRSILRRFPDMWPMEKSESGWWMEVSASGWQRIDNGEPTDHP